MSKTINEVLDLKEIEKLKKYLKEDPKIIFLPHANPDGDTLGAALALYTGLKDLGFKVDIACATPYSDEFKFLHNIEDVKSDFDENDYDAVVFTDCGNKKMVQFHEEKPRILSDEMVKINIDHHMSNDLFGEINFVNTSIASTTMIVFKIFQALEMKITPKIATQLLLGIYTDTGSFMHQNTDPLTYFYAAELLRLGANYNAIGKNIFRKYELKTLKLWAKVLKSLHITKEGAAIVGVEKEDYESIGCTRADLAGVIDFINSMPEVQYSVLLSEDEKGNVKGSLRTRKDDVDLKGLAEKFGGGGHVKASGFTIKNGHLEKDVKWKIVQE